MGDEGVIGLAGRRVVLTGASRGIGRACALRLAGGGARILAVARGGEALEALDALAGEAAELPGRIVPYPGDVTDETGAEALAEEAGKRLGGVDALVNNAGASVAGPFLDLPDSAWMDAWRLKVMGYVRLSREVFPHMRERGGRIVNVIGDAGRKPLENYAVGGVVNAALMNFTKTLANEGGKHNIIVNAVNPGAIRNERYDRNLARRAEARGVSPEALEADLFAQRPISRAGTPEEVVGLVLFLASEQATFVHGTLIDINGGASSCI